MPKPTARIRIAFADGPFVASPTWTDVTSYVRAVKTSRGRTDDWQDFDTGTASVVLDNRTRRFDPTYTAGPYYGNLQPRRQICIDATTDGGSTYKPVFRGYIDGWPVHMTDAGFDSTVTVNCYDILGLISQTTAPYDWADLYIRTLNPHRYIKFDDVVNPASPSAATFTDYGSANTPFSYNLGSTAIQSTNPLAPGLPYKSANMPAGSAWGSSPPSLLTTDSVSACVWTALSAQQGSQYPGAYPFGFYVNNSLGQNISFAIAYVWVASSSQYELRTIMHVEKASPQYIVGKAAIALDTAAPHHFGLIVTTLAGTPAIRMFLDGVEVSVTTTTTADTSGTGTLAVSQGKVQQAVMVGSDIGATGIQTIYNLSIGNKTETTAARFTSALQQTSIPAALYSATASPAGTVTKVNNGGEPLRNTIQYASDSEGGETYVTRDGILTMTNRTWYLGTTAATSQASFGNGGIPIGTTMNYAWNADTIRNALNMKWSGDTTVNVVNTSSATNYGTKQNNYETQLSTASDTQTLGTILTNFGALPRLVMSAIELNQALSLTQWATVLGLDLLQRITVTVPEKVGSNLSQQQIIQQVEHTITPGTWETTILGSSRWSSVFVLDSSVLDGTDLLG